MEAQKRETLDYRKIYLATSLRRRMFCQMRQSYRIRSHQAVGKSKAICSVAQQFLILKPPRKRTETGFEVSSKMRKAWRCFPRVLSFHRGISEPNYVSCSRHGAGTYHSCVRCSSSFEGLEHCRKRPNRLLAVKTEAQRQIQRLKELA